MLLEAQNQQAAPDVSVALEQGLYGEGQRAQNPWGWTSVLARRIAEADAADAVAWRPLLDAIEADDRDQLAVALTDDLRHLLYGEAGRASSAELVAMGLLDQANKVRGLLPSVPEPPVHLAEAIRAYGDFLALRHPRGQTALVPTITAHHPFDDAIDPSSPAVEPPTGIRLPDLDLRRFSDAEIQARVERDRQAARAAINDHARLAVRAVKRDWGLFGGIAAVAVGVGTALWAVLGGRP